MPRVTEVIDYFQEPYLVNWKLRVGKAKAKKFSQQALDIGSYVDKFVSDDIFGRDFPGLSDLTNNYDEETAEYITNCIDGWKNFKKDYPVVLEAMRKHKDNMQKELILGDLVGHPDFILGDEICDLKTSKQVSKSHWMQTAQYAKMFDSWYIDVGIDVGPRIRKISILRLDKIDAGDYEYKILKEPFIKFWQSKFQARYDAFMEDVEFSDLMKKDRGEEHELEDSLWKDNLSSKQGKPRKKGVS